MLKRPNPYRKTRAAGTLDDLMFDMDKRRHTSFRFQNYQNFITDRPGKFDERYRQKLSWCALDEETGHLDYLTEGLSPKGARRMSTSSIGSSRTAGGGGGERDHDRDSLLSNQAQQQQNDSADSSGSSVGGGGGSRRGNGGEDDAGSTSTRGEEPAAAGFLSPARFRPPSLASPTFMSPPICEGGGGGGSVGTSKPQSGRSWKAPQFAIDMDNHGPGVLLEHSPTHHGHDRQQQQQRRRAAANDEVFPNPVVGIARSLSPSPGLHRQHMQWAGPSLAAAGAASTSGPRRSTSSSSSSGRRSSTSAFGLGTGPVRGPGSWARGSACSRSSTSTTSSKIFGGFDSGHGGGDETPEVVVPAAGAADGGAGAERGGRGPAAKAEQDGGDARAPLTPPREGDEDETGDASPLTGVTRMVLARDEAPGGRVDAGGVRKVAGCAGEDDGVSGGAVSAGNPGREASYGTVSSSMFLSGADDARGSLLASFSNLPRKSEESTYFESNASTATAAVPTPRGGNVGGVATEDYSAAGMAMKAGAADGAGTKEEQENQGRKGRGRKEGRTRGGGGGGGGGRDGGRVTGREPSVDLVLVRTADPAALLLPPRVGDGKLEHDKERRLGVASDLEAVIAELSRRKSLLAWEDGEGAASDPSESPVRVQQGGDACPGKKGRRVGDGHQEEEEPHLSTGLTSPLRPNARGGYVSKGSNIVVEPMEVACGPATKAPVVESEIYEPTVPAMSVEPSLAVAVETPEEACSSPCGDENKVPAELAPLRLAPAVGFAAAAAAPTAMVSPSAAPAGIPGSVFAPALASAAAVATAATGFDLRLSAKAESGVSTERKDVADVAVAGAAAKADMEQAKQRKEAATAVTGKSSPAAAAATKTKPVNTTPSTKTKTAAGGKITKPSCAPPPATSFGASPPPAAAGGGSGLDRPRATAAAAAAVKASSHRVAAKGASRPSSASAQRTAPVAGYCAPTKSSQARAGCGGGGGGGGNGVSSSGRSAGTAVGSSSSSQQQQQQQQRGLQRKQKPKESPRSKGGDRRGRERTKGAGQAESGGRGGRRLSSSAPPPQLRDGDCCSAGVKGVCADIITPSDLVTSVQEQAEGAPPLSGVPAAPTLPLRRGHHRSTSAGMLPHSIDAAVMDPAVELADAALTMSGVRTSVAATNAGSSSQAAERERARGRGRDASDRRSMAAGGDAFSLPRKGKYQVKDSFNRLKGWINGGFANSGGRKNNTASSSHAAAPASTSGAGTRSKQRGAAADGRTGADVRSGDRRSSSAVPRSRASTANAGCGVIGAGGAATSKGNVVSRNLTPNAAVDRAAARVEARRIAERDALTAVKEAGAAAAAAGTVTGAQQSSCKARAGCANASQRWVKTSNKASPRSRVSATATQAPDKVEGVGTPKVAVKRVVTTAAPAATEAAVGHRTPRGRVTARPLEVAVAGSSSSPSPSRSPLSDRVPPSRIEEAAAAVAAATGSAAAASAAGDGIAPRKIKAVPSSAAATAAAAVALSAASERMALVAPALSSDGPSARAKTFKAARSLGATIPALSPASSPRAGARSRRPVKSPGPLRIARGGASSPASSPRTGARSRMPLESPGPLRSPMGGVRSTSRSPRSGGFGQEGGFFGGRRRVGEGKPAVPNAESVGTEGDGGGRLHSAGGRKSVRGGGVARDERAGSKSLAASKQSKKAERAVRVA